jgi:hypothetical protein
MLAWPCRVINVSIAVLNTHVCPVVTPVPLAKTSVLYKHGAGDAMTGRV